MNFRKLVASSCLWLTIVPFADAFPPMPINVAQFNRPIRVACIGDSITQGSGAEEGKSYPSQLQELLGAKWQVGNFGVSARTLLRKGDFPYWNESAFQKAQEFKPDVVIIMLGTNDTKPQNWAHKAEFASDYSDMVKVFLALPGSPRVYACRPPPTRGTSPQSINEPAVREQIPMIDALATKLGAGIIDMHAALLNHLDLLPDGVHPDTAGAGLLAKAAARALAGPTAAASEDSDLIFAQLSALSPSPAASVAIVPNSLFQDNAVLQRGLPLPVWGTAPAGTQVTVDFAGQHVSATAQGEKWTATLRPLTASDQPRSMVISSRAGTITLKNILVGDVWVAGGQSNMERQLGPRPGQVELTHAKEEIASANYPLIRQYYVPQKTADTPATDADGKWAVCTPQTAPDFTAVGYYFARDLQKAIRMPVGIIHSSWGGSPAQTWISAEALKLLPQFKGYFAGGKNPVAGSSATPQYLPTLCFNGMIAPLLPFPIRGVIWYQGEANASDGKGYRTLFPAVITDWRAHWKLGDFPFLFVQIAPHSSATPELREAQLLTLAKVPATAMAVTVDVGDPTNIHPPNKEPIGQRLALAARALANAERIEYSGPLYQSMSVSGNRATIKFTHDLTGLIAKGGALKGFTIAGGDKKFVPAEATISGVTVVVSAKTVNSPTAVRYGWEAVPDVNLFNKEGLPASPFRTDVD